MGLHLVDKVGGFYDAVDLAKSLAHIDANAGVRLKDYDSQPGLFGKARQDVSLSLNGFRALSFLGWAMTDPKAQALMDQVSDNRLREQGATVLAPRAYRSAQ
jgi:protease-4